MNLSLDTVLEVLENPNRRRILAKLVQESHYPLQLANELHLTQQAVMKHLKVMEQKGLVDFKEEPSSRGGPPRKSYYATQQFSVRIDLFDNSFDAKLLQSMNPDLEGCSGLDCAEDMSAKLTEIRNRIDLIEQARLAPLSSSARTTLRPTSLT